MAYATRHCQPCKETTRRDRRAIRSTRRNNQPVSDATTAERISQAQKRLQYRCVPRLRLYQALRVQECTPRLPAFSSVGSCRATQHGQTCATPSIREGRWNCCRCAKPTRAEQGQSSTTPGIRSARLRMHDPDLAGRRSAPVTVQGGGLRVQAPEEPEIIADVQGSSQGHRHPETESCGAVGSENGRSPAVWGTSSASPAVRAVAWRRATGSSPPWSRGLPTRTEAVTPTERPGASRTPHGGLTLPRSRRSLYPG